MKLSILLAVPVALAAALAQQLSSSAATPAPEPGTLVVYLGAMAAMYATTRSRGPV